MQLTTLVFKGRSLRRRHAEIERRTVLVAERETDLERNPRIRGVHGRDDRERGADYRALALVLNQR